MAKFMRDDAVWPAIDARGRRPESADLVGDAAAERCAGAIAWTGNHEKQEFIFRRVGRFLVHPLHRVDVVIVEAIALRQYPINVEAAIRNRICHWVIAVFLGPEEHEVIGGLAMFERVFAVGIAVIIAIWHARDSRGGHEHFLATGFQSFGNVRGLTVRERRDSRGEKDGKGDSGFAEYVLVHIDFIFNPDSWALGKILYAGYAREETKTTLSI